MLNLPRKSLFWHLFHRSFPSDSRWTKQDGEKRAPKIIDKSLDNHGTLQLQDFVHQYYSLYYLILIYHDASISIISFVKKPRVEALHDLFHRRRFV